LIYWRKHRRPWDETPFLAEKERFREVVKQFKDIAEVEAHREKPYRKLLANIKTGKVFKKDVVVTGEYMF